MEVAMPGRKTVVISDAVREGGPTDDDADAILESAPHTGIVHLRAAGFSSSEIEQIQELVRCLQQHKARAGIDPRKEAASLMLRTGQQEKLEISFYQVLRRLLKDVFLERNLERRSNIVDCVFVWFKEKHGESFATKRDDVATTSNPEFDAMLARAGYTIVPNSGEITKDGVSSYNADMGSVEDADLLLEAVMAGTEARPTVSADQTPPLQGPDSVYGGSGLGSRKLLPWEPERLRKVQEEEDRANAIYRIPTAFVRYGVQTNEERFMNKAWIENRGVEVEEQQHAIAFANASKSDAFAWKQTMAQATTHRISLRGTVLFEKLKLIKDMTMCVKNGADQQPPVPYPTASDVRLDLTTKWGGSEAAPVAPTARPKSAAAGSRPPSRPATAPSFGRRSPPRKSRTPFPPPAPKLALTTALLKRAEQEEFSRVQSCFAKWDVMVPMPAMRYALLTPDDKPYSELHKLLPRPGSGLRAFEKLVVPGERRRPKSAKKADGAKASTSRPARAQSAGRERPTPGPPKPGGSQRPLTRLGSPVRNITRS